MKVASIGYVFTWNSTVYYSDDLTGSGLRIWNWFSPIGWILPSIDPTGKMIVNILAHTYFENVNIT